MENIGELSVPKPVEDLLQGKHSGENHNYLGTKQQYNETQTLKLYTINQWSIVLTVSRTFHFPPFSQ